MPSNVPSAVHYFFTVTGLNVCMPSLPMLGYYLLSFKKPTFLNFRAQTGRIGRKGSASIRGLIILPEAPHVLLSIRLLMPRTPTSLDFTTVLSISQRGFKVGAQ